MSKKILFVASVATHLNTFHIPIIEKLQSEGNIVDAAAFDDKKQGVKSVDNFFNIQFERSPLKIHNVSAYKQLKNLRNVGNYDIVHCHTPVAAMLTRLAFKKSDTKIIYTAHGFHFFKGAPLKNWLLFYPIEKWMSKYTDILVTINKEDYRRSETLFAKSNIYIPGVGIDVKKIKNVKRSTFIHEYLNIPKDKTILLSVGELNDNKNHIMVMNVIKEFIEKKNTNYVYVIAGTGDKEVEYEEYIKENNLSEYIYLLGYRTDIIKIMKSSDIFIFPSKREGLPVSIIEAMASDLPIIASNVRGNRDLVNSNEIGTLFELSDYDSLISAINRVSSKLDIELDIDVYNYDIDNILSQMSDLYI